MKVGLSLIDFNPGRMGGVESYFSNLLESLQRIDKENQYLLLCDERSLGHFKLSEPNFKQVLIRSRQPVFYRWARSLGRRIFGLDILKFAIDDLHLDVVHHPFNLMSPRQSGTPVVLTVHDVQHEYYPEFFAPKVYQRRKSGTIASLAATKAVISVSQCTKNSLVERYAIEPEKVTVIHLGKDTRFCRINDESLLATVREQHGLSRPFLYFPAASWPHKNHAGLLRALRLLIDRHSFDGELVMSGIAERAQGDIELLIAQLGLTDRVRVLGYLDSSELPAIYNLARMLVYPSLFEGFGIPVVEAMACGCPIACSNTTSLPEVAGDAAMLFDPTSPEAIADAVWAVWSDEEVRLALLEKAKLRVRAFDWDAAAKATLDVYRRVAGASSACLS